jgi:hypothetical protein
MLKAVAAKLDAWVIARNLEASEEGGLLSKPCRIRVLGQTALLEAGVTLHLNVTNAVVVYANYGHSVGAQFRRLLAEEGKELDPLGKEVWIPRETRYSDLFRGEYVTMQVADAEAVLLSKALKAPQRNRSLIVEYLATGASPRFLAMAERYAVDLAQFV